MHLAVLTQRRSHTGVAGAALGRVGGPALALALALPRVASTAPELEHAIERAHGIEVQTVRTAARMTWRSRSVICPARVGDKQRPVGTLYIRQLLVGRDIGRANPAGKQMQNFVYLVGDKDAGACFVVDPAWDVAGIVERAGEDGMKITGALVTHYHPDHVGGSLFGLSVEGLADLVAKNPCKVHVHKLEADGVKRVTGISEEDMVRHEGNDRVSAGEVEVELLHTPGHTPGSQCFRLKSALVSGDTLFLQGCGRVDLPGGSAEEMERTLSQRLSKLPDDLTLYPGHAYGGEHAPLGEVRRTNPFLSSFQKRSRAR